MDYMNKKKKCKWCYEVMPEVMNDEDMKYHEKHCNFNDGGREDMNYEDICNYFYN